MAATASSSSTGLGRRTMRRACAIVATAGILLALAPVAASALSISASADCPRTFDVTATLDSDDPSGTVMLVVDGKVSRVASGSPASDTVFSGLALRPGRHRLRATLRGSGGIVRSDNQQLVSVWGAPGRPKWLSPAGGYGGRSVAVRVRAGSYTTSMTFSVNGGAESTRSCRPGQAVSFGTVSLPKGTSTFRLIGENPFGEQVTFVYRVKRMTWPYATCIIIDKSSYRLYWVKNGSLVKTYRIAIGKPSTPTPERTWKILSKERSSPGSVYGPRRLRLYKRSGSGWARTGFMIHGTNQPWVIPSMASHGCIRLYNHDISELWPQVPYGTMVITRR